MSIPRKIFSVWLSESKELPPLIAKCLPTHKIEGYEHTLVGLMDAWAIANTHNITYLKDCLITKRWAKAADYLRVWMLYNEGGIYADADIEMLPSKNFDSFLEDKMFCGKEKNGFVSNALIGAEAGHPILKNYLKTVEENFLGSGDLIYQPGMYLFTERVAYNPIGEVKIYPPPVFLPYDWQTDVMEQTNDTICIHWFNRSWLPK